MKNKKIIYVILGVLAIFVIFFAIQKISYKPIESIKHFKYSYFGGWITSDNVYYEVNCNNKCVAEIRLADMDSHKVNLDGKAISRLINIINRYQVLKWDGYNKRASSTDLASFSLEIDTKDNKEVRASGYGYFPRKHDQFKKELNELFDI